MAYSQGNHYTVVDEIQNFTLLSELRLVYFSLNLANILKTAIGQLHILLVAQTTLEQSQSSNIIRIIDALLYLYDEKIIAKWLYFQLEVWSGN
ncbi:hypothetical protein NPIL_260821 [Nephila pilipes]|uniref:Uncharacterized protein n=1 Tax=Nephila pilipes TaxID=299642 RepID=A0A8X6MMY8_NEPPI|nr:hypothetical protein NPIL_260821 [Nephila pilipes]